tara:strand:- start:194 stop:610 length:417 start_codon:yes stop_codon:yes gene_type:complete
MADLSITAANVIAAAGATLKSGTAGATVTAGQVVYLDTSDSKFKVADATDANAYAAYGVALNGASNGQPIDVCVKSNDLDIGATLTVGEVYVLSESGGIAPVGDLTTGDYAVVIGVANATDSLRVNVNADSRSDNTIA